MKSKETSGVKLAITVLVKFALVLTLLLLSLFDYMVFDILKSKQFEQEKMLESIPQYESITWYRNPFNDKEYLIFYYTQDGSTYLLYGDVASAGSLLFTSSYILDYPYPTDDGYLPSFHYRIPVEWWVYVTAAIIVIIFPGYNFKRKRTKGEVAILRDKVDKLKNEVNEFEEAAALKKELQDLKKQMKNKRKKEK